MIVPRLPRFSAGRRLAACHDIEDLRRLARRRAPGIIFDLVEGGADEEISIETNRAAFRRWRFSPRSLQDVSACDVSASLWGADLRLPLVLAPTGFTQVVHGGGERAVAAAAAAEGVPYTLSAVGTTAVEDVVAAGNGDVWFQLYVWRDRAAAAELVDRVWEAGCHNLVVSVDVPVPAMRTRDLRNGLTIPPRLGIASLASVVARPHYWLGALRAGPLRFAHIPGGSSAASVKDLASMFDPALTWDDIAELRGRWAGRLVVKGPLGPRDARMALQVGADGIQISNHGGRQLDRTVSPLDLLPAVRATVGEDFTLLIDSGVMHGADIALSLALGADAVAVGRVYLYGLMAGGSDGVARAIEILAGQLERTMALLGVSDVAALRAAGRELVKSEPESGIWK